MLKYLQVPRIDSVEGVSRLQNILKSLLLRRTKTELKMKDESALPKKTIKIEVVDLSSDESTLYKHALTCAQILLVSHISKHQPEMMAEKVGNRLESKKLQRDVHISMILLSLLRLRQICNHTGLIHDVSFR